MSRWTAILIFLLLPAVAFAQSGEPADAEADAAGETNGDAPGGSGASLDIEGENLMGREVGEVYFDIPETMIERRVERISKIKEGRELSRRRCRKTIESLYLRGDAKNVKIKATIRDDGKLFVKVEIEPLISYRDLFLVGNSKLNEEEIRRILRFNRGAEYREKDKETFRDRIEKAYDDLGYLAATVDVEIREDPEENKADLFLRIDEGKPFRMRELVIDGQPAFPEKTVFRRLGWKERRVVRREAVEEGVERLREFYRRRHYLEARVEDPTIVYDHEERAADLYIEIRAGKRVRVYYDDDVFTWHEWATRMDKVLQVEQQRTFNRWVVREMESKVKAYLQRKGYYNVEVISEFEETGEQKTIRFSALTGDQWEIDDLVFEGAYAFDARKIRRIMEAPEFYEPDEFEKALTHVVQFYNRNGFLGAEVESVDVRRDQEKHELDIRVFLNEGPQTILQDVRFEGNEKVETPEFEDYVTLTEGEPLNPFAIRGIQNKVVEHYSRNGYIRARVQFALDLDEKRQNATLVFQIKEGQQYFFGDVHYKGNRLTKRHVIERELFIEEDAPFNYEDLFRSEQALNRLGFFKSVKIEPVPAGVDQDHIDLIVRVVERNSGFGSVTVGYNTVDGFNAAAEIGHRNLAGHGRKVSLLTEGYIDDPSFRISKRRAALSFTWPWIARIPLDGTLTLVDRLREEELFSADEFRIALGVSSYLDRLFYALRSTRRYLGLIDLARFFRVDLEYAIEQNFVFDVDDSAVTEGDISRGEYFITSLTPRVVRDSRNDAFHPTRGSVNEVSVEWATPYLGSQVHYVKPQAGTSWYFSMDPLMKIYALRPVYRPLEGSVYAFNISAGWVGPLGRTEEVPVNKRFFLGGITNLRGYNPSQIGPRGGDRNKAIGGSFMLYANQDLRFRLPYNLGFLLFFDLGNVYEDIEAFTWGDIRYSTGLGFRYYTPVGPISVDYAFALTRWPDTDFGQFYISIGNAF